MLHKFLYVYFDFSFGQQLEVSQPKSEESSAIGADMVSRRKILSRSRDDLTLETLTVEEEDVWYHKEKLFKVSL